MQSILISDVLLSKVSFSKQTKDFSLVIGGSWLIAALAQIAIYLPFTLVPITGQTFGILLVASAIGSKRGVVSVVTYIFQGTIGLPFFAGGTSGIAVLVGPTVGYLIGFLVSAYVIGYFSEKSKDRKFKTALPSFFIGYVIIFAFGIIVLGQFVGWKNAIYQGLIPFIPGEIIKLFALSSAVPFAWKKLAHEKNHE